MRNPHRAARNHNADAPGRQDVEDRFARFREGFPALEKLAYMSICDKMILHDRVRASIDTFLTHLAFASANRVDHEQRVIAARAKFARMMNVAEATIAVVRNVSDGINSIAWALPWRDGDNLVISTGAEHPNNTYPWLRLKRRGVDLRLVPVLADGAIDIDAMMAATDNRTRLLTCPSVSFAPGHRVDIDRLAAFCGPRDIFFAVDGVQSAGILHHNLAGSPVSGFATSTSKGLLGLYGFGFLYIAPEWMDRLEPAYLSRPAVAMESDDHSAMGTHDYTLQPDSRRFELGSYNLAGAYAADCALDLLLDLGTQRVQKRVLSLAADLKTVLSDAGLKPGVSATGPDHSPGHSHVVTAGALDQGGHGFSNDPRINRISKALTEANIVHTIRRGQLRFGLHGYNDETDISQVDAVLRATRG